MAGDDNRLAFDSFSEAKDYPSLLNAIRGVKKYITTRNCKKCAIIVCEISSTQLLDAFPAQKTIKANVGVEELLDATKADSQRSNI